MMEFVEIGALNFRIKHDLSVLNTDGITITQLKINKQNQLFVQMHVYLVPVCKFMCSCSECLVDRAFLQMVQT